jgi:hypothetical protein
LVVEEKHVECVASSSLGVPQDVCEEVVEGLGADDVGGGENISLA